MDCEIGTRSIQQQASPHRRLTQCDVVISIYRRVPALHQAARSYGIGSSGEGGVALPTRLSPCRGGPKSESRRCLVGVKAASNNSAPSKSKVAAAGKRSNSIGVVLMVSVTVLNTRLAVERFQKSESGRSRAGRIASGFGIDSSNIDSKVPKHAAWRKHVEARGVGCSPEVCIIEILRLQAQRCGSAANGKSVPASDR